MLRAVGGQIRVQYASSSRSTSARVCWGMAFEVDICEVKPSASHDTPAILIEMAERFSLHHEDVGAAIQRAIPPRRVPLGKRIFWRIVLWLLHTSAGRALIVRRYATHRRK